MILMSLGVYNCTEPSKTVKIHDIIHHVVPQKLRGWREVTIVLGFRTVCHTLASRQILFRSSLLGLDSEGGWI